MLPYGTTTTSTALAGKRPAEALQQVEAGEANDKGNEKGFHALLLGMGRPHKRHGWEDILNENRFQLKKYRLFLAH